jgi:hypothetical protein
VRTIAASVRAEPKRRVDQDGSEQCKYITNPFHNRRNALGHQLQPAAHSPGTQPLPRVRGYAPVTGLSMRVIGMDPGHSARVLSAGKWPRGHLSGVRFAGIGSSGRGLAAAVRIRAAVAESLFGSGGDRLA